MPAHARNITDWTATAQLHELIESWTPDRRQRAAATTRLRVLAELAELKAATMPTPLPRHSLAAMVIRWRPPGGYR